MAETAAEVLHNIGNAVNSANCCVENLNQSLLNSKLSGLGKGIALLKQASHSPRVFFEQDPRAPKLVEYLTQLNNSLEQEQSEKGQELSRLQGTIRHIRDVISAQNHLQFESEFLQETKISELLDELRMIIEPKLEKKRVDLNINVESDDSLLLNRNRMVQVLLNLAKNAIESMSGPDCENRALKIRVQSDPEATHFEITDTGKGFDESIRNRLFSQGFTTRQGGSGLGLHYCANAIHQAGGSISALSDGPGKGATFRIRLPHQHRGEPQAKNGADLNGASAHGS
jgi:signal transduction histidine kinase